MCVFYHFGLAYALYFDMATIIGPKLFFPMHGFTLTIHVGGALPNPYRSFP